MYNHHIKARERINLEAENMKKLLSILLVLSMLLMGAAMAETTKLPVLT